MKQTQHAVRIGDGALKAKTGKNWDEWFKILDRAGASKMNHTAIATYLYDRRGCPGWWCQMVAAGYEQARGLREKYQTPRGGYEISVSRTMSAPATALFKAWRDGEARERWLPQQALTIRKATPNKSLRITWADRRTSLDVYFYPKGLHKTQVNVQHRKLPDGAAATRMKRFWAVALGRLAVAVVSHP
jgi:uncharacterized protein YndB with AHSA1/START domain